MFELDVVADDEPADESADGELDVDPSDDEPPELLDVDDAELDDVEPDDERASFL